MRKLVSLSVIACLAMVLTSMGASAQYFAAAPNVQRRPHISTNDDDCAQRMGHMRQVSAADINAIHPGQDVGLIAICEDQSIVGRDYYGSLFLDGNVNKLRVPIRGNATLMQALAAENYDEYDVISLRYGAGDSILLYVHQRYMPFP